MWSFDLDDFAILSSSHFLWTRSVEKKKRWRRSIPRGKCRNKEVEKHRLKYPTLSPEFRLSSLKNMASAALMCRWIQMYDKWYHLWKFDFQFSFCFYIPMSIRFLCSLFQARLRLVWNRLKRARSPEREKRDAMKKEKTKRVFRLHNHSFSLFFCFLRFSLKFNIGKSKFC